MSSTLTSSSSAPPKLSLATGAFFFLPALALAFAAAMAEDGLSWKLESASDMAPPPPIEPAGEPGAESSSSSSVWMIRRDDFFLAFLRNGESIVQ